MPIPRRVARWNRAGVNRVTAPLLRRLPGFGVVVHTGRHSGRTRHTPVMLFDRGPGDRGEGYVVALTYGPSTDWLRNVLAAGGCQVLTRGRSVTCASPRLVHDDSRALVPAPVRPALRLLDVADFLTLTAPEPRPPQQS